MRTVTKKAAFITTLLSFFWVFGLAQTGTEAQQLSGGTLLVDFGASEAGNLYGVPGWNTVIKGPSWADKYFDAGSGKPKGITGNVPDNTTWGDAYPYSFHAITGPAREFLDGEKIITTWYNNSDKTIRFYPLISLQETSDPNSGGEWDGMSWGTIPPHSIVKTYYEIDTYTAGTYSVVNIAPRFANKENLICDKIEIVDASWEVPQDGTFEIRKTRTITANVYTGRQETDASFVPNGEIIPGTDVGNLVQVNYGTDISFTFIPNPGFNYTEVIVDGKKVSPTGNTYTFRNVKRDHVISVGFFDEQPTGNNAVKLSITHNIAGRLGPSGEIMVKKGSDIFIKYIPHRRFGRPNESIYVDGVVPSDLFRNIARRELHLLNVTEDHTIHVDYRPDNYRRYFTEEDIHFYKPGEPVPTNTINPDHIEYLGAFKLPPSNGGSLDFSWAGSYGAIAYRPGGDPGSTDNHPGSLFGVGWPGNGSIAEITIPEPVISKNLNNLPSADFIQRHTNISDWYAAYDHDNNPDTPTEKHDQVHEMVYIPSQDKIFWSQGQESYGDYTIPHHGWTEPILGTFRGNVWEPKPVSEISAGVWHIGNESQRVPATGVIMFEIEQQWAHENLHDPDKILVTSGAPTTGIPLCGPSLYAIAPWKHGDPPPNGASLDYEVLLKYDCSQNHQEEMYTAGRSNGGGAWAVSGNNSALILYQQASYGDVWYNGHGFGGSGSSDNSRLILKFYNPADIADVVQGRKQPYEPQPYAKLDITDYFVRTEDYTGDVHNVQHLSGGNSTKKFGMAYDRARNYLYLTENSATGNTPVIHVFRINGGSPSTYTYMIDANAEPGGSISPEGTVMLQAGEDLSFTITPDPGYQIDDVEVDEISQGDLGEYSFTNVQTDHTIRASFEVVPPASYTIDANAEPGGSISPEGTVMLQAGEDLSFTITPDPGYQIADVEVDGMSQGALGEYAFTNVQMDHSIQASFEAVPPASYMIDASAEPGGNISPEGTQILQAGEALSFKITPDPGYQIADVEVDGMSQGALGEYAFTNVQTDHSIRASFEVVPTESYFGFNEFGGTWHDAELLGSEDLFWAAATANILEWAAWDTLVYDTAQQIAENFEEHWSDEAGLMEYGWNWWLSGYKPTAEESPSQVDDSGAGNYWSSYSFREYFYEDWADLSEGQWSKGIDLMQSIDEFLHSGYGVALVAYGDGTQELSVWGYEYDETGNYTGIWITDSTDGIHDLIMLSVDLVGDLWYLDREDRYGYENWFISGVQALDQREAYPSTPEPGTLLLLGTGLLSVIALKRRYHKK